MRYSCRTLDYYMTVRVARLQECIISAQTAGPASARHSPQQRHTHTTLTARRVGTIETDAGRRSADFPDRSTGFVNPVRFRIRPIVTENFGRKPNFGYFGHNQIQNVGRQSILEQIRLEYFG